MPLPQGAVKRIVHGEKWRTLLHGKVVDAHNVRVVQASEQLRLGEEGFNVLLFQQRMQDFERGTTFQIDMLTQIDLGEAASSKQAQQTIVAKLLAYTGGHL
jgi:hypothetical protein